MTKLKVGDIELNYNYVGDGSRPVLIFSNSLGTDHRMWDAQASEFGGDYDILRYDTRGHGQSTAPMAGYSIDTFGRDVLALMDHLKIKKASFCGLSMGGMTGMWLGINAPERFDKLILSNTSAHMPPVDLWNDRIKTVLDEGMNVITDSVIKRWFTETFRATGNLEITRISIMLMMTPREGYAGCCGAIRDMDQRETIKSITLPVMIIAGADDPATPPAHAEVIHQAIAGSRLEIIANAAHLSNIEQPKAFNALLRGFLDGK